MSNENNTIPQVGRAEGPKSHSIQKMDSPTDSGGGTQTTKGDRKDVNMALNTNRRDERDLVFAKRSSISRTPPKVRSFSLTELEDEGKADRIQQEDKRLPEQQHKRKRAGSTPERADMENTVDPMPDMIKALIGKISGQVNKMDKLLKGLYKPRQDIKELTARLLYQVERLQSREVDEWFDKKARGMDENMDNRDKEGRDYRRNTISIGTQTEVNEEPMDSQYEGRENKEEKERQEIESAAEINESLRNIENETELIKLLERTWPERAYQTTELKTGNPLKEQDGDLALFIKNQNMDKGMEKKYKERYPELAELIEAGGLGENMAHIKLTTEVPENGGYRKKERHVIGLRMRAGADKENSIANIIEVLQCLKVFTSGRPSPIINVPAPEGIDGEKIRKIAEYVFRDTDMKFVIFEPKGKEVLIPETKGQAKRNTTDTGTVIVKAGGREYADILKKVKVEIQKTNHEVQSVRKSKDGDLVLSVRGGEGSARNVKELITKELQGAEIIISNRNKRKTLHIIGMDGITTEEEVMDAFRNIGVIGHDITLKSMRPAYGGSQNATIEIENRAAINILKTGKIKIGWINCRLVERVTPHKCHKCQEYGHVARNCQGPEREERCLQCGKTGHKAKECKDKDFCPCCNEDGHRIDSMKCPIYRKLVVQERKKAGGGGQRK